MCTYYWRIPTICIGMPPAKFLLISIPRTGVHSSRCPGRSLNISRCLCRSFIVFDMQLYSFRCSTRSLDSFGRPGRSLDSFPSQVGTGHRFRCPSTSPSSRICYAIYYFLNSDNKDRAALTCCRLFLHTQRNKERNYKQLNIKL